MSSIQKINRITLTDQIVNQLQNLIESKHFIVGEKLPSESELCDKFGASRSTIREALRVLAATGLIATKSGVGAFVCAPQEISFSQVQQWFTEKHIELGELIELRTAIETLAMKLTINKASEATMALIVNIHDEFIVACKKNDNKIHLTTLDDSFHSAIVEATGNRLLIKIGKLISDQMLDFRLRAFSITENVIHARIAHQRIVDALIARDEQLGMSTMVEHLESTKDDMEKVINYFHEEGTERRK